MRSRCRPALSSKYGREMHARRAGNDPENVLLQAKLIPWEKSADRCPIRNRVKMQDQQYRKQIPVPKSSQRWIFLESIKICGSAPTS